MKSVYDYHQLTPIYCINDIYRLLKMYFCVLNINSQERHFKVELLYSHKTIVDIITYFLHKP